MQSSSVGARRGHVAIGDRAGFTLIELLTVVIIIGILTAIALPKFGSTRDKATLAAVRSDVRNAETAEEAYFADSGEYGTLANLQTSGSISLSPGTTMFIVPTSTGYAIKANNPAITTGPRNCGVQVGSGTPTSTDGVIQCF